MSARALPVLVVTTPTETSGPLMDAEDLQRRVGEIADVVVLHNGPASWALAHAMPAMTQVYGGAGRVYPIDLGWLTNPYRAPIRFCWPGDDPRQVADQLEDDAFGAANLDGLTATRTAAAPIQALGTVKGFVGRHHAVLALNRGGDSLLLVDQLYPGVEPGRLLRPGQALSGQIDRAASIPAFQPDPVDDDPHARVASAYATGDVVLARVTEVSARSGQALLHPKVTVPVLAGDDESDLRTLVAVDDVVTLTLTFGGGGALAAELADSDAASVPCLPVLPGGPPWLVEADLPAQMPSPEPPSGQPEAEAAEQAGASAAAAAAAAVPPLSPATIGQHAQIAGLSAQVNSLTTLLDRQSQETARQARAARLAREEVQRLRRRVKSLTDQHQAHRDRVEGTALFSDPEQQLRFDIEQTWLRRTPEAERSDRPLHAYQVGPEFLNTLARLQGIRRDKVLDVLVEVLTDRARDIPGRELHPLREAEASQVQLVRGDGAKAWRCALQVNTPSARRLHYWRLPDGTLELDSVGTHDQGL